MYGDSKQLAGNVHGKLTTLKWMDSLVDCFVVTGCNLGSRGDPLKCRQGLHVADVAAFPIQSVDIIQNKQPIHDVTDCTFLNKYYGSYWYISHINRK